MFSIGSLSLGFKGEDLKFPPKEKVVARACEWYGCDKIDIVEDVTHFHKTDTTPDNMEHYGEHPGNLEAAMDQGGEEFFLTIQLRG